ncbi:hypothetical protein [Ferruginibacter sp. SUN106]|uniref:hypothetical protein n=1 Tax=Ferruginibacter sp. SUN106 TaxID=2978348 RepID=UPI003D35F2E5
MKNIGTDYFTQLRSDFIPKKKDQYDHSRRPFNPADPAEAEGMPATILSITDKNNTIPAQDEIYQGDNYGAPSENNSNTSNR